MKSILLLNWQSLQPLTSTSELSAGFWFGHSMSASTDDPSSSSVGTFSTMDAVEMVKMPCVFTRTLTFTLDFSPSFCAETFWTTKRPRAKRNCQFRDELLSLQRQPRKHKAKKSSWKCLFLHPQPPSSPFKQALRESITTHAIKLLEGSTLLW